MPGDHLRKLKLMAQLRPNVAPSEEASDEGSEDEGYRAPVVKARYMEGIGRRTTRDSAPGAVGGRGGRASPAPPARKSQPKQVWGYTEALPSGEVAQ